ncbi:MAG: SDR family NAD(P)-dependent oxidoreductase [Bacteroidales bacterium]|nr:SDR family NAD(P)-dependent oxidoreductase [Bacteroidales bacterium]
MENKIALITGATSGIGKATAYKLAKEGYNLIITGRRVKILMELEVFIQKNYKVRCISLNFDIREPNELENSMHKLPKEWHEIELLINNAGLALGMESIHEGDLQQWNQMIDTNIKGLLHISKMILPGMVERKSGHIINISSIAGKEAYGNGAVYCGTKHAVEAITKGMRIDLLPHGIKVSSVSPGMVDTGFSTVRFSGNKEKAEAVYKGLTPLYAEDIADTIAWIASRPKHVNINDVLIMPTAQANASNTYKKI